MEFAHALTPQTSFRYQAYDPRIEKYAEKPVPAEMVCVINVLENLPWDEVDEVLDHLESLTEYILFCVIDTTSQPMEYWLPKLWLRFSIQTFQVLDEKQFMVIANNPDVLFE